MKSRFLLKMRAKQAIFTTKPSPMLAGLMLTGVYFLIYIFQYTGNADAYNELIQSGSYTATELISAMYKDMTSDTTAMLIQLMFVLLNGYISFGMLCYSWKIVSASGDVRVTPSEDGVNQIQFASVGIQEMFPPVLLFIKNLIIIFLVSILVSIGLVFFIVPGIVLYICYSQSRYIMLEHPEMSVIKCMAASRKLMRGRIGEYFMLSLSFLGWQLMTSLCVITGIWTYPYINITMALYYKDISSIEA